MKLLLLLLTVVGKWTYVRSIHYPIYIKTIQVIFISQNPVNLCLKVTGCLGCCSECRWYKHFLVPWWNLSFHKWRKINCHTNVLTMQFRIKKTRNLHQHCTAVSFLCRFIQIEYSTSPKWVASERQTNEWTTVIAKPKIYWTSPGDTTPICDWFSSHKASWRNVACYHGGQVHCSPSKYD